MVPTHRLHGDDHEICAAVHSAPGVHGCSVHPDCGHPLASSPAQHPTELPKLPHR